MKIRALALPFLGVLLVAASACAKAPTPSTPARPGGAQDLVLRVDTEGGFISPAILVGRVPSFSLFADGTVITTGPQPDIYPGSALPSLLRASIDTAGVRAIVDAAKKARLTTDRSLTDLASTGIADAATTVFTFVTDGTPHTVRVYALAESGARPPSMSPSEYAARQALAAFEAKLTDLRGWLPHGSVSPTEPYRPTGSRVYVAPYRPDPSLTEPALRWPLATPLASFGTAASGYRCGPVTGEDWAARLGPAAARATQITPWTSGGARYGLIFRPLLPDEHGC
jgi:hypothetical protein